MVYTSPFMMHTNCRVLSESSAVSLHKRSVFSHADLDPSKVYVIGGLVDHNHHKVLDMLCLHSYNVV